MIIITVAAIARKIDGQFIPGVSGSSIPGIVVGDGHGFGVDSDVSGEYDVDTGSLLNFSIVGVGIAVGWVKSTVTEIFSEDQPNSFTSILKKYSPASIFSSISIENSIFPLFNTSSAMAVSPNEPINVQLNKVPFGRLLVP